MTEHTLVAGEATTATDQATLVFEIAHPGELVALARRLDDQHLGAHQTDYTPAEALIAVLNGIDSWDQVTPLLASWDRPDPELRTVTWEDADEEAGK